MLYLLGKCKSLTSIRNAEISQSQIFLALRNSKSLCSSISNNSGEKEESSSFTAGDLTNSCGLSRRLCVRSKSSEKQVHSVLKLLGNYGITQTQVETIASKSLRIFRCNPQRNLKPKIDFLRSVGISQADVASMIATSPFILLNSLENHLVPSFDMLRPLLGGQQNLVTTVTRYPFILSYNISKNLAPNFLTLRNLGVPKEQIAKMMTRLTCVKVAAGSTPNRFSKVVRTISEMGFDPLSSSFVYAVEAMGYCSESRWEGRLKVYGSLGFSDKEILSMFRTQPMTMLMSEKKIRGAVEFYVNKFHWSPSKLSERPNLLIYSLEKRIIPRCSVLQVLRSRNRILRNTNVLTLLTISKKAFVEKYLTTYMDQVPEVWDAYQGKLKFDEYNFGV